MAAINPLAVPAPGSEALALFLRHFDVSRSASGAGLVEAVSRAFSRIPYENLTKVIKFAELGSPGASLRGPLEVLETHVRSGAGGTCFSLTAAMLHVLRSLGFRAEPILADRSYGPDTHCALIVWLDGAVHLVDPGFLLLEPIAVGLEPMTLRTDFNEVELVPSGAERVDLFTRQGTARTHRLTFKMAPADEASFLRAWEASFDWDMMRYPVLTRVDAATHLYLQDHRVQRRRRDGVERTEVSDSELLHQIIRDFGIDMPVARRALGIFARGRRGPSTGPFST